MIEIILLIVGVFYAFRKLKLSKVSPEDYPNIEHHKFSEWKAAANKAISIFLFATWGAFFIKLVIYAVVINMRLSKNETILIAFVIFSAWFIGLIIAAVFDRKAHKLKTAIGIKWP